LRQDCVADKMFETETLPRYIKTHLI